MISLCAYSAKICIGKSVQPSWIILLFFKSLYNTYNSISFAVIQGNKLHFMAAPLAENFLSQYGHVS